MWWTKGLGFRENLELGILEAKLNHEINKCARSTSSSATSGEAQRTKEDNAAKTNANTFGGNNTESKNEQPKNEDPKPRKDNVVIDVEFTEVPPKRIESKSQSKKEKKKEEQQKKAEAEGPREPAGAEVNSNVEAAMGGNPIPPASANPFVDYLERKDGIKPNFDSFIVKSEYSNGQHSAMNIPNVPSASQASATPSIPQPTAQQCAQPTDGNKVKFKLNIEKVSSLKKKKKYDAQEIPVPSEEDAKFENKFDNSAIISKYPLLKEIEDVAIGNRVHVEFSESNTPGIIVVDTYDANRKLEKRCFMIDTGNIIDHRWKVFPFSRSQIGDMINFETAPCFSATNKSKENKKLQVLNVGLFDIMFKGAVDCLSVDNQMFSQELKLANIYIDMVTMLPMAKYSDRRNKVRETLIEVAKSGFFESLRQQMNDRFIRFIVKDIDKDETIFMENGAPINYGCANRSSIPIKIAITKDFEVTIEYPNAASAS